VLPRAVHRWQSRTERPVNDSNAIVGHERVATDVKCVRATFERLEDRRDVFCSPDFQRGDVETKPTGCLQYLVHLQRGGGITDIGHNRQPTERGNNFAQKFESLGSNIGSLQQQAGDVTARPRQTHHETIADRVPCQREDDRYDRCRPLCCQDWCGSGSDNDVNLEPDKLRCDLAKSLVASLCPPIFDCYVAALDPAEFAQSL
jgi:hypothetical protein